MDFSSTHDVVLKSCSWSIMLSSTPFLSLFSVILCSTNAHNVTGVK